MFLCLSLLFIMMIRWCPNWEKLKKKQFVTDFYLNKNFITRKFIFIKIIVGLYSSCFIYFLLLLYIFQDPDPAVRSAEYWFDMTCWFRFIRAGSDKYVNCLIQMSKRIKLVHMATKYIFKRTVQFFFFLLFL